MEPVTILVVDDDALLLRIILRPLVSCGGVRVRDVLVAKTPEEAIALVDHAPPGPLVVVSDFNLKASMNGHALLAEVQRRRPDALRILMSGYSREQLGPLVDSEEVQAFVEKTLRLPDTVGPMCDIMRERFSAGA